MAAIGAGLMVLSLLLACPVDAQAGRERITSYDAAIVVGGFRGLVRGRRGRRILVIPPSYTANVTPKPRR